MGWNLQAIGLDPKEEGGGRNGWNIQAKGLDLKKKVEFVRFTLYLQKDESLKSQLLLRLSLAWSYIKGGKDFFLFFIL
ncbi:MAG: hypothetical protein IKH02_14190 [Prevotella sp.]|nr:hypothetical protein [Prevotella sp.]